MCCSSLIYGTWFMIDTYFSGVYLFTTTDFLQLNFAYTIFSGAMLFQAMGLKNGLAGVVSALENLKVTW